MKKATIKTKKGPEAVIQEAIIGMLKMRDWHVEVMHGNMYQRGIPDLYATHVKYGQRWVEVKLPNMEGSYFTPAQLEKFPLLEANGAGVWVLTGANETEYAKLMVKSNYTKVLLAKML